MDSRFVVGKKTLIFLSFSNILLLCLGWIMAVYAYPRLPVKMVLWINFFGQQTLTMEKSILFFIYPLAQTLFCAGFWHLSQINWMRKPTGHSPQNAGMRESLLRLRKEFVLLVLIFFHLIFIHLQRTLILVSHGIEKGVSEVYFYSLFGIILILIPYYRIRKKLMVKRGGIQRE